MESQFRRGFTAADGDREVAGAGKPTTETFRYGVIW